MEQNNQKNTYDIDSWNKPNLNYKGSKISSFFIKYSKGLIKNEDQANIVMIILSIIFFSIAFFTLLNLLDRPGEPSPDQIIEVAV